MVLGICEEGLSFRAVAPLKSEGPVYFTFAPDGKTRLNGAGEIVWSDDDGKSGGLKFTNTYEQFRESLRSWLASEATTKTVGREVTPAAALSLDSVTAHNSGARSSNANKIEEAKPETPKPTEAPQAKPIVHEAELGSIAPIPTAQTQVEPTFTLPNFRL